METTKSGNDVRQACRLEIDKEFSALLRDAALAAFAKVIPLWRQSDASIRQN